MARGARGGRGNARFATSTNRAPRRADLGRPGEERWIRLELKLLADVGVIGFPNAGKSTLVSRLSAAKPKIADYPFTTLVPALGIVRVGRGSDASSSPTSPASFPARREGKGLGHRFLRHTERTRVLVHLIDLDPSTGPRSAGRLPGDPGRAARLLGGAGRAAADRGREQGGAAGHRGGARGASSASAPAARLPFHAISAVTGEGLPELVHEMAAGVLASRAMDCPPRAERSARRVVVKVGSGLVTTPGEGPSSETIARLAGDLAALVHDRREVALVSSGAIATGMARLGLKGRPRSIPEKQAAAAVGQSALMWHYEQAFKKHGIPVGQVLLTGQDISDRSRYLNARNTLLALLDFGVLPVDQRERHGGGRRDQGRATTTTWPPSSRTSSTPTCSSS